MTNKSSPKPRSPRADDTALVGELTHSSAPMPTPRTVRVRTFLPYQLYRLATVNVKMLKMIRRPHTH